VENRKCAIRPIKAGFGTAPPQLRARNVATSPPPVPAAGPARVRPPPRRPEVLSVGFKSHGPHASRRPLRKQGASKDAPGGVCDAARATWIVLGGPSGAPQDEGGGLLKQTLREIHKTDLPIWSDREACPSPARGPTSSAQRRAPDRRRRSPTCLSTDPTKPVRCRKGRERARICRSRCRTEAPRPHRPRPGSRRRPRRHLQPQHRFPGRC
jgi:hypothetical protein